MAVGIETINTIEKYEISTVQLGVHLRTLEKQREELERAYRLIVKVIDDIHATTGKVFYSEGEEKQLADPRLIGMIAKLKNELGPRLVQDYLEDYHE